MHNKTLQQFYNAYAAWLDAGAPEGQPFRRATGLCINLWECSGSHIKLDPVEFMKLELIGLDEQLINQFKEAGLDVDYPFNVNREHYQRETYDYECHTNPLRIKWVKDHANNQQH